MLKSLWGRRLAALYLLVVAFAGGFVMYHVLFTHRSAETMGILLIVMGLPWSSLLGRAVAPETRASVALIMGLGMLVNTALFYLIGASLEHFRKASR
jgi:hypothetical protein